MLVLCFVQVVQTNNNEYSWNDNNNNNNFSVHKLIVKEFKLNVNRHIKTSRNHNLLFN
jgi:hypothetical protein